MSHLDRVGEDEEAAGLEHAGELAGARAAHRGGQLVEEVHARDHSTVWAWAERSGRCVPEGGATTCVRHKGKKARVECE